MFSLVLSDWTSQVSAYSFPLRRNRRTILGKPVESVEKIFWDKLVQAREHELAIASLAIQLTKEQPILLGALGQSEVRIVNTFLLSVNCMVISCCIFFFPLRMVFAEDAEVADINLHIVFSF